MSTDVASFRADLCTEVPLLLQSVHVHLLLLILLIHILHFWVIMTHLVSPDTMYVFFLTIYEVFLFYYTFMFTS